MHGPRVQQYLLYSNSHFRIIDFSCDLVVFLCSSVKNISSHLGHVLMMRYSIFFLSWCSELNVTQVLSCIVPGKKRTKKTQRSRRNICCDQLLPNAVLHPALLNRKPVTSCSTVLVTLTWSQSHLQKKKSISYCVYIYDKCKGFLPFHVSPVNAKSPFLISSQCVVHFL